MKKRYSRTFASFADKNDRGKGRRSRPGLEPGGPLPKRKEKRGKRKERFLHASLYLRGEGW
jgi:hypothetical protein